MTAIRAVLWDFGGVISDSPFDAFARYERERGLPAGFLRGINATNHETNAWAHLERNEIDVDTFCVLFEAEARDAGHAVDARAVLVLLSGALRPAMVQALRRCHERLKTALLTNNFIGVDHAPSEVTGVLRLFDLIVESSKAGIRKPDPRFYELACTGLGIEPAEAVFLDDLGINLKPARAMGITTIKVDDPANAIAELEAVVGFPLD
jgi:putative hydrolase of the HAD superfamily